jgi:hypothetical protein
MLLPVRILGVKRSDGVSVVLAPTALPNVCPALRSLSWIHAASLDLHKLLEPDSVSALDEANTGTDPDPHYRGNGAAQTAGVAEREVGAGARGESTSSRKV